MNMNCDVEDSSFYLHLGILYPYGQERGLASQKSQLKRARSEQEGPAESCAKDGDERMEAKK